MFRKMTVAAIAATAFFAGPAQAHPKLVSSTPAANANGVAPKHVDLHFSEKLMAKFSGAELVMVDMPGMAMKTPMKMPATASVGGDGKTLSVVPARPLPAGTYRVDYHIVSTDTHRVTGSLVFRVK
ncbi:methionine-rich copper-binding protein CopC [Sphingomonas sp. UYAg733]